MKTDITNRLLLAQASSFRLYLQSELARLCASNPQYSLRSFALRLGINHSTLSQILRGKRALTPSKIESLGARLGLKRAEIEAFIMRERQAGNTAVSREIRQLTLDTVTLLSDSNHRAILELTTLDEFVSDSRWIARALDLSVDEVNMALSRLTRLGLLEMTEKNRWVDRSGASAASNDSFAQFVIRRLSECVRGVCATTTETMSEAEPEPAAARVMISATQLPAVLEVIEQLQREAATLEPEQQEYQLVINLSPINRHHQTETDPVEEINELATRQTTNKEQ